SHDAMPRFNCSQCEKHLKAPVGSEGKRFTCPKCQTRQAVPAVAPFGSVVPVIASSFLAVEQSPPVPGIMVSLREIASLAETLGGSQHAETVRDVAALLQDKNLRVAVFGEFSVGKSTLINALLGCSALPFKARPTTGHATQICFGES